MYNYVKNSVAINAIAFDVISQAEKLMRKYATDSVANQTAKHALEDKIATLVKDGNTEGAKVAQDELDALNASWKEYVKNTNVKLFGDRKTKGLMYLVSDDLYKAYVNYVKDGKNGAYRDEMRKFCLSIIESDNLKDGAYNHMYNDILLTMSSTKLNSNAQLAQGASFITTINKRTYCKMLYGAIIDIINNNHTLKVAKSDNK